MNNLDNGFGLDFLVPRANIATWQAYESEHPASAGSSSSASGVRLSSGHSQARSLPKVAHASARGYSYAIAQHLPAGVEDQRF